MPRSADDLAYTLSADEAPRAPAAPTYRPELDGVRGAAVLAVLVVHYLPAGHWLRWPHAGVFGLYNFFLLSGFLITGTLLDARSDRGAAGDVLRPFYTRRILRIFPVYYLTLLVLTLLGDEAVTRHLLWHVTYTSNFESALFRAFHPDVAHFWSLCVEEQFYLIWPAAMLYLPHRHLARFMVAAAAIGIVYKAATCAVGFSHLVTLRMLPGCLDPLAIGGWLALRERMPERHAQNDRLARLGFLVATPAFLMLNAALPWVLGAHDPELTQAYVVLVAAAATVISAAALVRILRPRGRWVLVVRALASWPLRSVGKVSYGLYVYHYPLLGWVVAMLASSGIHLSIGIPTMLVVGASAIALATVSWHVLEKPLLELKRYAPYPRAAAQYRS